MDELHLALSKGNEGSFLIEQTNETPASGGSTALYVRTGFNLRTDINHSITISNHISYEGTGAPKCGGYKYCLDGCA